jgi:hypothetical protein
MRRMHRERYEALVAETHRLLDGQPSNLEHLYLLIQRVRAASRQYFVWGVAYPDAG